MTLLALLILSGSAWPGERKYRTLKTEEMLEMLERARSDIKSYYFDGGTIPGLDIDKRFETAKQEITARKSEDEGLLAITAAVSAVNDLHTRFVPPPRPYIVDYGWQIEAIGNSGCFVTRVRPESDAFRKGLRPGDQVRSVNGVTLNRQDIDVVEYAYQVVPQSGRLTEVFRQAADSQIITTRSPAVFWSNLNARIGSRRNRSGILSCNSLTMIATTCSGSSRLTK